MLGTVWLMRFVWPWRWSVFMGTKVLVHLWSGSDHRWWGWLWGKPSGKRVRGNWCLSLVTASVACYCIALNLINCHDFVCHCADACCALAVQVHSMYWPAASCQISGQAYQIGVLHKSRSCPHWCPCAMEFRCVVVPLPRSYQDRGPFMFIK